MLNEEGVLSLKEGEVRRWNAGGGGEGCACVHDGGRCRATEGVGTMYDWYDVGRCKTKRTLSSAAWRFSFAVIVPRRGGMSCDLMFVMMVLEPRVALAGLRRRCCLSEWGKPCQCLMYTEHDGERRGSVDEAKALEPSLPLQPCDSWSGGCGQAATQCCHMVNVLNDHLSEPHLSLIRTS